MYEERAELEAWRQRTRRNVSNRDAGVATRALLELTFHEPRREFVERVLRDCFDSPVDGQVRRLAVTCVGHVARIHGAISLDLVLVVYDLLTDPDLGGTAENAIDDIRDFVPDSQI